MALLAFMLACTRCCLAGPSAKPVLTVADAIQTTRFMSSARGQDTGSDGVFVSPDGKRYVVMLIRGDLQRNGNWVEFLSGDLDSFRHAREPPRRVARLFTQSLGTSDPVPGVPGLTWPRRNPPTWLPDNERIQFFWPEKDVIQAVTLAVSTGQLTYLTHNPQHVVAFDMSPTGGVMYSALAEHSRERSEQLLREGFKVQTDYLFDLLNGDVDGYGADDRANNAEWFFVAGPGDHPPRRVTPAGETDRSAPLFRTVFAPDGKQALIEHSPAQIPESWSRYTERILVQRMAAHRASPDAPQARFIKQLSVVDLATARIRPLWRAPATRGTQAAWSPDGRSLLLGPVMLPLDDGNVDEVGLAGSAIAEVDVASGRYRQVTLPAAHATAPIRSLRWLGGDRIEVLQQASRLQFNKSEEGWKLAEVLPAHDNTPAKATVRMEWRQDLNTPPVLHAVDGSPGRSHAVLDPNAGLKRFQLGFVEMVQWKDGQGREWRGRLYHPAQKKGQRVPLVIQTHGSAPETQFDLYGKGDRVEGGFGLGPGFSAYAAQALAGRDIAVLQIDDLPRDKITNTPEEPVAYMHGYESAIEHLAQRGLIDRNRVGLMGFSRTGWHVLYALTHSSFPFAAALVSDNFDGGYIQAAAMGWNAEFSQDNGAEPFGEGLKSWFANAPAFNIEQLNTPLRMQLESQGRAALFGPWEIYSRARYLKKTVELYVIPDLERGNHRIQNPAQCLASQQGAVDWFDSWLNKNPR